MTSHICLCITFKFLLKNAENYRFTEEEEKKTSVKELKTYDTYFTNIRVSYKICLWVVRWAGSCLTECLVSFR